MAANSTLARVLSFTKSLPLVAPAAIDATTAEAMPLDATPIDGDAALDAPPADMPFPAATEAAAASAGVGQALPTQPLLTVELPSLAQLTLVPGETPADESRALAPPDAVREAVTVNAITAIEADIASLLATMGELSDARPATDQPAHTAEDDDGEDATLTLLSELDRLWRADPMIGAAHHS